MEAKFNPIDLATWPRGQMFYYFTNMAPCGYSMTVDLDITTLKSALEGRKFKFFPSYLWLITKILNKQMEFKVAMDNEILGYWDKLNPLYATFHDDDKTISLMWTGYDDCFSTFYNDYVKNQQLFGNNHGILSKPNCLPPPNSYIVSCIPWVQFKHFSFHSYENKNYFFPTIEAGKFYENNGKLLMPLSVTVHHATTDGWHIMNFLNDLQYEMDHPEIWVK